MASFGVSVIMPAYNCEKYIAESIQSVLDQTYTNFELLVIDDGSTDNQRTIVEEFARKDERVKYLFQRNSGVSSARNKGIKESSGCYLAFLDADDVWLAHNLEFKIQKMSTGSFGLVHSDALVIDETSRIVNGVLSGMEGELLDLLLLWDGTQVPGPSSVLMSREAVNRVGLFDEDLSTAADKDLFIRVAQYYTIGRVPEITWKYRIHTGNMHKNISLMERDILHLYEKTRNQDLFKNRSFENKCFSSMYLILAASWAGDGKSYMKALPFVWAGIKRDPWVIFTVFKKILRRIMKL